MIPENVRPQMALAFKFLCLKKLKKSVILKLLHIQINKNTIIGHIDT